MITVIQSKVALWLYDFNPFPLRDFPYLTSFAGAEKVTPLHTYLPHRGTSHKRCGSTANAFLSLTRNSGSTTCVGRKGTSTARMKKIPTHIYNV
ncbi:MAG: hypothetical protein E7084_08150 [Bacteroidales bacterium]|nr:hypothetical protein [Bacteroidales bacterium]